MPAINHISQNFRVFNVSTLTVISQFFFSRKHSFFNKEEKNDYNYNKYFIFWLFSCVGRWKLYKCPPAPWDSGAAGAAIENDVTSRSYINRKIFEYTTTSTYKARLNTISNTRYWIQKFVRIITQCLISYNFFHLFPNIYKSAFFVNKLSKTWRY